MDGIIRRREMVTDEQTPSYELTWHRGKEYNGSGVLTNNARGNYCDPIVIQDGDIINMSVISMSGGYTRGVQFDNADVFINARQNGSNNTWNYNLVGCGGHKFAFSWLAQTFSSSQYSLTYIGNTRNLKPTSERPVGYESIIFGQDNHTLTFVRTHTNNNVKYVEVETNSAPSTTVIAPPGMLKAAQNATAMSYQLSALRWNATVYSGKNILGMSFPVALVGGEDLSAVLSYLSTHRIEFYVQS